jgi:hypothetical protein
MNYRPAPDLYKQTPSGLLVPKTAAELNTAPSPTPSRQQRRRLMRQRLKQIKKVLDQQPRRGLNPQKAMQRSSHEMIAANVPAFYVRRVPSRLVEDRGSVVGSNRRCEREVEVDPGTLGEYVRELQEALDEVKLKSQ